MIAKKVVLLLFVMCLGVCDPVECNRMNFLPMPVELTCGKENITISDPCKLFFHVKIDEKNN
jgi:hypothetical protein